MTEPRPLAGLRVVEIGGGVPAAFATRFLAGYGAEVVRCEANDEELTPGEQAALLSGKRRIRVDDATLRRVVLAADAVVEDGAPGALAARGLAPEALREEKPGLVVTSLTPFGQTGPHAGYAATNLVAHAAGGIHSLTGVGDRPPLQNGAQQAWKLLGLNGFGATLTALFAATLRDDPEREGDWIDISAQECAAGMLELFGPRSATDSIPSPRLGNRTTALWGLYPALDGYAGVCALHRQVPTLFELIGDPELREPRFLDPRERMKDDAELSRRLGAWFARHRKRELIELGAKHRVPFGAVWTPGELLENAALRERGFFDAVDTPEGRAEVPGRLFLGLPWEGGKLSEPGADTDTVLSQWLGAAPSSGEAATEPTLPDRSNRATPGPRGNGKRLPLEGIRVADLTMMWAGPYATRVLADMGAEIVKIESPSAWDNVRTLLPVESDEPWNASFYFNDYNRDKKSLTLDLAQPRGRELFLELVGHCDVVIENYRADVLDKLDLGYDVLRAARSDIVLVSMAGFGKTGAERDLVGFGPIVEQMAGLTSLTGYGDDGVPYKTGVSYGDPVGGLAAVSAIVLALFRRRRTGEGVWIDLAQRETMAHMACEAYAAASLRGDSPVHRGNRHPVYAPQGVYPVAGEDQWLALSVRDDEEWRALAARIGAEDLGGLDVAARRERHDEIDERITRWTREQDPQAAMDALQARGIPASRVLDTHEIHWDPHLVAREAWTFLPHPKMDPWPQPMPHWRFQEARPTPRRHAPLFGEHNREILCGLLAVSEDELPGLEEARVIGDAPIGAGVG